MESFIFLQPFVISYRIDTYDKQRDAETSSA